VKLPLGQNISRRLTRSLNDQFPDSAHVADIGLAAASDRTIWDFAAENGFMIVSKDADFHHLGFLLGAPPKAVWLAVGNCKSDDIAEILLRHYRTIAAFDDDAQSAVLILGKDALGQSS
jgi:predicted nuclease of predicted toxin-antitoxin system